MNARRRAPGPALPSHADDLAAPRAVLDGDLGRVLAQRVGELGGDLPPQARGLRRGVGGDVNRPLGVTTHTALGTPFSFTSTWTWPASGIGISTEPRSSRPTAAADGSSKSSMSNGPSSSSSTSSTPRAGVGVLPPSSLFLCLPNAITNSHVRRRNRGRRRHGWCLPGRPRRTTSPRPARAVRPAEPATGRSGRRAARRSASAGSRLISATLISPRYPASIVPGLLTIESPTRAAKPERGWTRPTMPYGIATAIPVGTSARWPGASSTSSAL